MKNVIRLGDQTSHGGKVITTRASHFRIGGVPVACVGDTCSCPMAGHNGCTIASGSKHHLINGVEIAFEGDLTTCGAKLISSSCLVRTKSD
jgi:uncharacterized Zn-binding protein involved in type VI secretion